MTRRRLLQLSAALALPAAAQTELSLLVCGWDEVFEIAPFSASPTRKLWSWRAADRDDIPADRHSQFRTTDDCKPLEGGRQVLITSSSNGVALVERPSGRVLFYAAARNAHSAEALPGGRIVVAASVGETGNRLALFDRSQSDHELFSTELHSGHGVVWDHERETLWALGGEDLRRYRLGNWDSHHPHLELTATYRLPTPGGHDLQPGPGAMLNVSSGSACYQFDRDALAFRPHPDLAGRAHVKCISTHAATGRVVFTHGEDGEWWTRRLQFLHPVGELHLPQERIYKARWVA